MHKYIKIAPDPDAKPCRCGDGNPDCEHFEFCPECGEEYKAHEGHDCLDGFAVAQVGTAKELRDAAKELRDSLDACETERDRLRAELDAAHDGEDALRSEVAKLRAQLAALQAVPQGVEVPEFPVCTGETIRKSPAITERDAMMFVHGFQTCRDEVFPDHRVPTPPQAAPGAVVEVHPEEFRRDDRYIVLKRTDLERHATPAQLRELERTCGMVRAGRATEGKRLKSYVVVADNWPEYEETWAKIQARVTGIPQPIQPEGRRVGPDEVAVSREEWEALNAFLEDWRAPESRSLHDWNTSLKAKAARINVLRTSAQDHNETEKET